MHQGVTRERSPFFFTIRIVQYPPYRFPVVGCGRGIMVWPSFRPHLSRNRPGACRVSGPDPEHQDQAGRFPARGTVCERSRDHFRGPDRRAFSLRSRTQRDVRRRSAAGRDPHGAADPHARRPLRPPEAESAGCRCRTPRPPKSLRHTRRHLSSFNPQGASPNRLLLADTEQGGGPGAGPISLRPAVNARGIARSSQWPGAYVRCRTDGRAG